MDNMQPPPKTRQEEHEADENRDTLRYEYSKGYMPQENPKEMDGEQTEIK